MLPKEYRLKKRIAFFATYKTSKSFYKDGITVFCGRQNEDNSVSKIGFVVSKKTHKRAVQRNRIKRLMRESVRLIIKNKKMNNKYKSLIFVASKVALNKTFNDVDNVIKLLLERI